ncbi:MAG: acetolactate synthase [Clostridia bacterium]|nr:acetolactate synthase [Clostridia bacterium]
MLIDQISVFIANKHGRLAELTDILSSAQIDIRALSIADTADFGVLRLIVNDPAKAVEVLKSNNVTAKLTKVIAARLDDCPGALASVLNILAKADIPVEYTYAFLSPRGADACVILRVDDNDAAVAALAAGGVKLLSETDVYRL